MMASGPSGVGLRAPSRVRQAGLDPGHRGTLPHLMPGVLGLGHLPQLLHGPPEARKRDRESPEPSGRQPSFQLDQLSLQHSIRAGLSRFLRPGAI